MMIVDVFQCYLKSTLRTSPSHAHDHHPATNATTTKTVFSSSFECGEVEAAEAAEAAEGLGSWHDWGHSQAFRILQRMIFFKTLDRVQLHSFSCTWYSFADQDFESFGYDVFLKSNKPATSHHPSPQSSQLSSFYSSGICTPSMSSLVLVTSLFELRFFSMIRYLQLMEVVEGKLFVPSSCPSHPTVDHVSSGCGRSNRGATWSPGGYVNPPYVCQWLSPQPTEVGSGLATAQKFALARWRGPAAPCGILTYHVYSCQLSYFRYWLIE